MAKKAPPIAVHGSAVEMVNLSDLRAYEKNARLHPEDQLKALEAIIRDSGFTAPLVIGPEKGCWAGDRKQATVWDIANMHATQGDVDDGKTNHSTQKPVECMRRPILNNSKPGQFVYEPFCGSGTTLIACEMEGRVCLALELDPVYAEVIITRWEAFTKKTATREDGKTLAQLKRKKAA